MSPGPATRAAAAGGVLAILVVGMAPEVRADAEPLFPPEGCSPASRTFPCRTRPAPSPAGDPAGPLSTPEGEGPLDLAPDPLDFGPDPLDWEPPSVTKPGLLPRSAGSPLGMPRGPLGGD